MQKLALLGGEKTITLDDTQFFKWPIMKKEEIGAVVNLMQDNHISITDGTGIIKEFEDSFAKYHRIKYALVQNSGTSTLHAAYFAVGIGPGDEVISPVIPGISQLPQFFIPTVSLSFVK